MTPTASSTSNTRLVIVGLGIGLNIALLVLGRFPFCTSCSGLNAVLAFPWPYAGLFYWLVAGLLKKPLPLVIAGFAAQAILLCLGRWANGELCAVCCFHFVLVVSHAALVLGAHLGEREQSR